MPGARRLSPAARRVARDYWTTIWTELGELLTDADRHPLGSLCALRGRFLAGETIPATQLAEARRLETAYGISPEGRRRLGIRVSEPAAAPATADATRDVAQLDEKRRQRQAERRRRLGG
jgi:hypothetical protein